MRGRRTAGHGRYPHDCPTARRRPATARAGGQQVRATRYHPLHQETDRTSGILEHAPGRALPCLPLIHAPRAPLLRRLRGKSELTLVPTARSCWLLTVGGVRGAVTLAGVMSVPLLLAPGAAFPERDLLIFIAAGVILLSLIAACIALPLLLRGIEQSPDEKRHNEVREAWKKTAVAAIHALEAEEPAETDTSDAAQAALAAELKARLMSEYRHQLEVFNDSPIHCTRRWRLVAPVTGSTHRLRLAR